MGREGALGARAGAPRERGMVAAGAGAGLVFDFDLVAEWEGKGWKCGS